MNLFIPIKNHPSYLINNNGEVFTLLKNRLLKIQFHKAGYPYVKIDRKSYLIHRLVAIHFVPNPNDFPVVHHIDNNPKNPHYKNLYWCTQAKNLEFAYSSGRKGSAFKILRIDNEYSPTCKFSNRDILAMRTLYEMGFYHSQIKKMFSI